MAFSGFESGIDHAIELQVMIPSSIGLGKPAELERSLQLLLLVVDRTRPKVGC